MSTTVKVIQETGKDNRDLNLTGFFGGSERGLMLQITQGFGSKLGPDEPGFIQLTKYDAYRLIQEIAKWIKAESKREADKIARKISENKALEKTIFKDAVECEKFIRDLEILDIPIRLLP